MAANIFQSPINIETTKALVLIMRTPLKWNGYEALPAAVSIENTGDSGVYSKLSPKF